MQKPMENRDNFNEDLIEKKLSTYPKKKLGKKMKRQIKKI